MDGKQVLKYRYFNRPGQKQVTICLTQCTRSMLPTLSTQLAIENLDIGPGDSVLDLGAGTGVVAIAAKMLGAGPVTALELSSDAREGIANNISCNRFSHEQRKDIETLIGDLFTPVEGRRFDQIIVNPPSMPCPPDLDLAAPYNGGPEGRRVHDVIQRLAGKHLSVEGKLFLVHSSLCDLELSMTNLRRSGYRPEIVAWARERFLDWYPIKHLEELKDENKAEFTVMDGMYFVDRYVINATMA